ncbi:flagellar biosynthesis protein [Pigmentiphaga aceris]|uniref:Flagellar biosynthesis protein n=1 Tax=Pigmentiphaga aceris TaxID=1940612 RepID=A0A5C0B2W1_9BURK|nr:flagellar biosynthesis protein [Pigmentiphaga aceris]QEI08234.1 flagellar biosynthesis protein [Pigmentiphaga aceris]
MNNISALISVRVMGICLAVAALAGCATGRDVIAPKFDAAVNPAQGVPVRIEKVEDARIFQIKPGSPSTPSLMDDNLSDEAIRSRAIARKRNGYGMALGDILVPEGQTIASLTQTVVARAFRENGFRVVAPTDADYARATPVTVRVNKLWAWLEMGFVLGVSSNYEVVLTGPIGPLQQGLTVNGQIRETAMVVTESVWSGIISKSLEDMYTNLKSRIGTAKP